MTSLQMGIDIHNQLVRYLAGEISLENFRDWFDRATWEMDLGNNEMAAEIELRLAEFSNGHRDEADLRRVLRPLTWTVVTSGSAVTGTSAVDFTLSWAIGLGSSVDIQVELVSA